MKDVAAAADVHPSTASRALHAAEPGRIPAEVIERVRRAAIELGYSRNTIAASLRTRRSNTIGVVVTDLTNTMFPPMLRGIEARLNLDGYSAIVANTDFEPAKQQRAIETFVDRRLDGIILGTTRLEDRAALLELQRKVPLVLMNRGLDETLISAIVADDVSGIAAAFDHLRDLGHRSIAHIAGPQNVSTGKLRHEAFLARVRHYGTGPAENPTLFAESFSEEEGRRCSDALLAMRPRPTAILAANDMLAIGSLMAVRAAGLICPDDISITGFNDMPFVDRLQPSLTTVRFDHHRMGYEAADQLLATIGDPDLKLRTIMLPPELMIRQSTSPRRHRLR